MNSLEEKFKAYRERNCLIKNNRLEIESLKRNAGNGEKIKQLEEEILIIQYENKKIDNILELVLSNKEYKAIRLFYLEGKDKKRVAKELDRTERHINRILNSAIRQIKL